MSQTKIEWADETWNPTTGCTKVSPGCKHCYALTMSKRLKAMGQPKYANGFELTIHEDELQRPLTWKKPRKVFVDSMSDLFHKDVPFDFISRVFDVIGQCPQHIFQILTKRAERLAELAPLLKWHPNIWIGVSVESQPYAEKRIPALMTVPASVRFLSCEPLLSGLCLDDMRTDETCDICEAVVQLNVFTGEAWCDCCVEGSEATVLRPVDWVIAGGESGPGARPMHPDWVRSLRGQCAEAGVPFLFKQWGEWVPWEHFGGMQYASQIMGDSSTMRWENFDNDSCFCELAQPSGDGMWEVHAEKVGKKKSGNHLDGRQHLEFPKP